MRRFEEMEHTADMGIRAYGSDLAELLESAAAGMFSLIGQATFRPEDVRALEIRIDSRGAEELLHLWLRRLLREFNVTGFFPIGWVIQATPTGIRSTIRGGIFDPERHEFRGEIKGVTLHGLTVARGDGDWRAEIIFDV